MFRFVFTFIYFKVVFSTLLLQKYQAYSQVRRILVKLVVIKSCRISKYSILFIVPEFVLF